MNRTGLMLLILILVVVALLSSFGTFLPHQLMMSGMMGGRAGGEMMNFLWPTIMTASTAVVAVAVVYLIAFPAIRYNAASEQEEQGQGLPASAYDPMDIVIRVTKPDERAALEVLKTSGGVCLQKDITYKTGFSKLKTHRIVSRLAERGIIQVKKVGKTNEIRGPPWLKTPDLVVRTDSAENA